MYLSVQNFSVVSSMLWVTQSMEKVLLTPRRDVVLKSKPRAFFLDDQSTSRCRLVLNLSMLWFLLVVASENLSSEIVKLERLPSL